MKNNLMKFFISLITISGFLLAGESNVHASSGYIVASDSQNGIVTEEYTRMVTQYQFQTTYITTTVKVTNTTDKTATAKYFIPYWYLEGLSPTDSRSFNGNVGKAFVWNSSSQQFQFPGYESEIYASLYSGDGFSYGKREEQALTYDSCVIAGENTDYSARPRITREIATASSNDSVLYYDFGTLSPGESKTAKYVMELHFKSATLFPGTLSPGFLSTTLVKYGFPEDTTVHYQDDLGNKISPDITLTGNIGDAYTAKRLAIPDYTFKELKSGSAAETGTISENAQEVTYVYTKNPVPGASVIAHHQDEAGNKIADDETIPGNIGDKYTTTQKTISGYTFKELKSGSAAETGTISENAQEVTYVYTKNPVPGASVIAHHQDEAGNKIADDETIPGNIGDKYTTTQKTISGYAFKELKAGSAAETGTISENTQEVTYVYTKNPVPVTPATPSTPSTSNTINNTVKVGKNSNKAKSSSDKTLPKTGEESSVLSIMVGLTFIALTGALILFEVKKTKKH